MEISRQSTFYRALRKAAGLLGSGTLPADVLEQQVRLLSRTLLCGVSLLLTDTGGDNLIHHTSWGLPKNFIQKGIVSSRKSLAEVVTGQPVVISDAARDPRIQYPGMTRQAGIASILGVPLFLEGKVAGAVRVYSPQPTEFGAQVIAFVKAMTDLISAALFRISPAVEPAPAARPPVLRSYSAELEKNVHFVHPSEKEFAGILSFYNIEWVYEPAAFPLYFEGDKVTEMFTPDFYLPALDLYVELTTLKQSLVTEKNRKLRRLRELHPEIKITLLYRRDIERLLAKYGLGPLSERRGRGVQKVLFSTPQINQKVIELAARIMADYAGQNPVFIGVLRGVVFFMADLLRQINLPLEVQFMAISYYGGTDKPSVKITKDLDTDIAGRQVVLVEDIVDTGMTLNYMLEYLRMRKPAGVEVCTLLDKRVRRLIDVPIKYIGFEIADEFVVGYGLDYQEEYRNLPYIGIMEPERSAPEEPQSN